MKNYLESFFKRVKPLSNLDDIRNEAEREFNEKWAQGKVHGWEKQIGADDESTDLFCVACKYLTKYNFKIQLSTFFNKSTFLIILKGKKAYSKKTVYDAHLKSKKHIKSAKSMIEKGITSVDSETYEKLKKEVDEGKDKREKEIAFTEALIQKYAEVLGSQREDTKANVERKRALTDRERRVSNNPNSLIH